MKKIILLSFIFIQSLSISAQEKIQIKLPAASPSASFQQEIGSATIKMAFSRPLVRGRKIFGELVPFGKLWRTGASDCTTISTNEDITFGNNILKAGTYSLFTIPLENEWTIIINSDVTLHGETGYDENKDVIRFTVPTEKTNNFYETFTIELNDINSKGEGYLKIEWENTMVKIPVKSKSDQKILALIDKYIIKEKSQNATLLFQSANYYSITGRANSQAVSWLTEAEKLDPENYYYPTLRKKISVELRDYSNAIEAAKKALAIAEKKKMKGTEKLKNETAELQLLLKNK
ncbi:hypothetical protein DBR27_21005 [Flavobacterium sp. HMWF030]|nr:hypothetical protein DBR27_21005 [Flavobacterium sp. HMWF030]